MVRRCFPVLPGKDCGFESHRHRDVFCFFLVRLRNEFSWIVELLAVKGKDIYMSAESIVFRTL